MASEVIKYDLSKLNAKPNIGFDDWVAMGMDVTMTVANFMQSEKNRNQIRKNINDAVLNLDEQIKSEKEYLTNQLNYAIAEVRARNVQAVARFEAQKRKLFLMLQYIDKKRYLPNYDIASIVIGISALIITVTLVTIKIINK